MAFPRRTSYGIFVRFRQSRLALRRGVTHLAEALEIAQQLRASRFHDRGEIFVVKEPEGTVVELGPAAGAQPDPIVAELPLPVVAAELPSAPPTAPRPPPEGVSDPGPLLRARAPAHDEAHDPGAIHHDRARVRHLIEQIDHVRRAIDRSHAALARFERAFAAAESLLQADGRRPSDAFRRNHQRLAALRVSSAKTVTSFEQTALLLERRLDSAWASAMASRAPAP